MSRNIHKIYKDLYAVNRVNDIVVEKGGVTQRHADQIDNIGSNTSFNRLNPPNSKTLMSKTILLETFVRVDYEMDDTDVLLSANNQIFNLSRFRKNAINKAIRSSTIVINGESFTDNNFDVVDNVDQMIEDYDTRYYGKIMNGGDHDMVSDLSIGNLPAVLLDNNPWNAKTIRSFELVKKQITQVAAAATQNPNVAAKSEIGYLVFRCVEPLYHYMLKSACLNAPERNAFYNVTSFDLTLNMVDDEATLTNRLLCGNYAVFDSVVANWSDASGDVSKKNITARVFYETPTSEAELSLLPKFDEKIYYYGAKPEQKGFSADTSLTGLPTIPINTDAVNIRGNTAVDVSVNNFVINSIPDMLLVYCVRKNKTLTDPDTYAFIDSLKITVGNDDSNFTSFNDVQLWSMSARNGLKYSYQQQHCKLLNNPAVNALLNIGGRGSFIIIKSSDLNLPSNIGAGTSLQTNINLSARVRGNHSGGAVDYVLYCATYINRVTEIGAGSAGSSENLYSADMLTSATPQVEKQVNKASYKKSMYGGMKQKGGYRLGGGVSLTGSQLSEMANKTVF